MAVRLVVEDGLPYRAASWHLWRDHRVFVPYATIQNWVEAGGKRAEQRIHGEYLTARWITSRGTSRPTSCTTDRFASSRLSTTAHSAASPTKCWTMIRTMRTSSDSSARSMPRSRDASCCCRASQLMARTCIPSPFCRYSATFLTNSVSFTSSRN